MDWDRAIERNREALKRVLAAIVAILAGARLDGRTTIPRRLHRAVLALLRPAEAATRRLVIVAARGLLPPIRPRNPAADRVHRRKRRGPSRLGVDNPSSPARPCLPLFDRLPGPRVHRSALGVPRISVPGLSVLFPVAPRNVAQPCDPIDATRLEIRLSAVAAVLDDLPRQAMRFARWRARVDAARLDATNAQPPVGSSMTGTGKRRAVRFRRVWPLRTGRPPGLRRRGDRRRAHEVHEILAETNALAIDAMQRPDTS